MHTTPRASPGARRGIARTKINRRVNFYTPQKLHANNPKYPTISRRIHALRLFFARDIHHRALRSLLELGELLLHVALQIPIRFFRLQERRLRRRRRRARTTAKTQSVSLSTQSHHTRARFAQCDKTNDARVTRRTSTSPVFGANNVSVSTFGVSNVGAVAAGIYDEHARQSHHRALSARYISDATMIAHREALYSPRSSPRATRRRTLSWTSAPSFGT